MNAREIPHAIRSLIMRGVSRSSADTGESQTIDATIGAGIERTEVEVIHAFGFASRAPAGGAVVLLAVGGDTGDLVALPVAMPGMRLGGLAEGEAAIHSIDGTRVHAKADGTIEVLASNKVTIRVGAAQITVEGDAVNVTLGDAKIEMTSDKVRGSVGASRFAAGSGISKLVSGDNYVVVTPAVIRSSVPIVVGADPNPSI